MGRSIVYCLTITTHTHTHIYIHTVLLAAQFNLGVCYDKGTGVAKDAAEAVKWYRRAVEQGHAKGT